ncbi:MAG TPA: hypothetical protein VF147_15100 [Vicinamibacterales bacterium]
MQAAHGRLNAFRRLACRRPGIDHGARRLGHDIRSCATGDDPDVDADAVRQILQPFDRGDLCGQFVNRAGSFARIKPGVRRHALHDDVEFAAAFARRLERTAR